MGGIIGVIPVAAYNIVYTDRRMEQLNYQRKYRVIGIATTPPYPPLLFSTFEGGKNYRVKDSSKIKIPFTS